MKSNIIQIKPIENLQPPQITEFATYYSLPNHNQPQPKPSQFQSPLNYLQPKTHRFFKKQYINQKGALDCCTIVDDFTQYADLLQMQQNRVVQQVSSLVSAQYLSPIHQIFGFYSELTKYTGQIMQRVVKVCIKLEKQIQKIPQKTEFQLNKGLYCYQCKTQLIYNEIEKIKSYLQIRDFEDKYGYYKIDAIKLYELRRLRDFSNVLLQSELNEEEKQLNMGQKSISLEQFQQILNLLGSDIHRKNAVFQEGITQIDEVCGKVDSQNHHISVQDSQLKYYQRFVGNRQISKKLKIIFKRFFDQYTQMKADKRRDAEVQVIIKDSEVIRELERERKELRMKLAKVESEKAKENVESFKTITQMSLQIKELKHHLQLLNAEAGQKFYEYERKLCQQKNLIDIIKKQLQTEHSRYSKLQMDYFSLVGQKRSENKFSKKNRTVSKRRTQFDVRKETLSPNKSKKPKSMVIQEINKSLTQNIINSDNSQNNIVSNKRFLKTALNKKAVRNTSIMQKKSIYGQLNSIQAQKFATYQSIVQKKQEEEHDELRLKQSRSTKFSRFRMFAGLTRFNIENQHNQANSSDQKIQSNLGFETAQHLKIKDKSDMQSASRLSQFLFETTLKKLYDYQIRSSILQNITYDHFVQKYDNFIKSIHQQTDNQSRNSLKTKQDHKERKSFNSSLSRTQSVKGGPNIAILKPRDNNDQSHHQNHEGKKTVKLQPLSKKGNYFLQKNKHFSSHESKKTISAFTSLEQSKIQILFPQQRQCILREMKLRYFEQKAKLIEKIDKKLILKPQQIENFFINDQKLQQYEKCLNKTNDFVMNPQENQFNMSTMALLAQLHLTNPQAYDYLKKVILNPRFWISDDFDANNKHQEQISLQNGLKSLIFIHRNCKDKQQNQSNCEHLQTFKSLILSFIERSPIISSVKKQKSKIIKEKSLSRNKSNKSYLVHS